MRAPGFWYQNQSSAWARIMSPFAAIYASAGSARNALTTPARAGCPVICVGNLVTGGAGKTPTAIAIVELLKHKGARPAFLTRGYRGREPGPMLVDLSQHDASAVGDEPLLLARIAPTWVSRNRPAGAHAAMVAGHDVIVMDDGFQNPTLHKDLSIVVIDGAVGFGNGHVMPAGPLRETIAQGLERAHAALIIGDDQHGLTDRLGTSIEILQAQLAPTSTDNHAGQRVLAFAGIGRPQKLFDSLREAGCEVVDHYAFPDHHSYSPEQIMALCETAAVKKAVPVTTAKDFVRLPESARPMVKVFSVTLKWAAPDQIWALLERSLRTARQEFAAPH